MAKKGKLIVLDGQDGTGKATQAKLLIERLRKEGRKVQTLDFPQYENNLFGRLIGECLTGKHGNFIALSPYIASTLYAADRFESKKQIEVWLQKGYCVVLDRYVSSNQMHQGGKFASLKERKIFLHWLDKVEHGVFGLPRPDAILYLSMPVSVSLRLLKNKELSTKKSYTKGAPDTSEKDVRYLENAKKSAMRILKENGLWHKIDCAPKGTLLSKEEVHDLVFAQTARILQIKKTD